jgi:hypothetical protein
MPFGIARRTLEGGVRERRDEPASRKEWKSPTPKE